MGSLHRTGPPMTIGLIGIFPFAATVIVSLGVVWPWWTFGVGERVMLYA